MIIPGDQSVFSHELRTPLTGVVGLIDLLLEGDYVAGEAREIVQALRVDASYLMQLIDGMLWTGKEDSHEEARGINPVDFVGSLLIGLRQVANSKGLGVEFACGAGVPRLVQVRVRLLRQVLTNLIGNAIRYTERGEVRVELHGEDDRDGLIITVVDSGIGMEADALDQIFKPYVQVHGQELGSGTGLGLWISRQLCDMLGADLRVRSRKDKGSEFLLRVPVVIEDATPDERSLQSEHTPSPIRIAQDMRRVLVVDDDPTNRLLLATLLKSQGVEVSLAEDGQVAVGMVMDDHLDAPFDLMLMDINMPNMDGPTAVRALRGAGYAGLICGMSSGLDVQVGLSMGFDHYLPKPVKVKAVMNLIALHADC